MYPQRNKGKRGSISEPSRPITADKLSGPPVYIGLTQSAVLLQMHTRLCKLEDDHNKTAMVIKELQHAVTFLMTGEDKIPGMAQIEARARLLKGKNTPSSSTSADVLEFAQVNASTSDFTKKKGKAFITKEISSQSISIKQPRIPSSSALVHSKSSDSSIIGRAKNISISLKRSQDPLSSSPSGIEQRNSASQEPNVQAKKLPDGSVIHRVKPLTYKAKKATRYHTQKKKLVSFNPPPTELFTPPSATSIAAPTPGCAMSCPDDPFAALLKR